MTDLAIVTSHFNWCDYKRPKANLERFLRAQERDGIPVYGVEAVLSGQRPMTLGRPGWRQVTVPRHAIVFQKEALLNMAERMVPDHYTKLAWVDADITFENPHWAHMTSEALDQTPVVQPFAEGVWLGREGEVIHRLPSIGSVQQYSELDGHPGFAMAARRELWSEYGGLFSLAVAGSGDSIAAAAFLGVSMEKHILYRVGKCHRNLALLEAWANPVSEWAGRKIAHVPGIVHHDFHGDRVKRQYVARHDIVTKMDMSRDVFIAPDGYLQWSPEADPEMMAAIVKYFKDRQEDA